LIKVLPNYFSIFEIENGTGCLKELAIGYGIPIKVNDFRGVQDEMVVQRVVFAILEGIKVPAMQLDYMPC
jgi:hypothetical protein